MLDGDFQIVGDLLDVINDDVSTNDDVPATVQNR